MVALREKIKLLRKTGVFYGYVIVITAFFILLISGGVQSSYGIFFKPMSDEFNWSRAATSGPYAMAVFFLGFFSMLTGRLTDRFGPRVVVTACGVILASGYALMSQISSVWQLYLFFGFFVAIGQSGLAVPMMTTMARWFTRRRGLMTGFVIAGIGAGQAIIPPVATALIGTHGWRNSFIIIGVVALLVIVILAQFLRRDPSQVGQFVDGQNKPGQKSVTAEVAGLSSRQAVRTHRFWILCAVYFCYDFLLQTTMVHTVPFATDVGISAFNAALIVSIIGGMGTVGRISTGSLCDRIGNRRALISVFAMLIAGFIILQLSRDVQTFYLSAVIFGFGYGGMVVLESPLVAELFGLKYHGAILGIVFFSALVGGSLGPSLVGKLFDLTGDYQTAFLMVTFVAITGLTLSFLIHPLHRSARS